MTSLARSERVGGLIQQLLSELLRRDISDPRLALTTITGVKVTKDLRLARVYFTTAGGKSTSTRRPRGLRVLRGSSSGVWPGSWGCATCPHSSSFTMRPSTTAPTSINC